MRIFGIVFLLLILAGCRQISVAPVAIAGQISYDPTRAYVVVPASPENGGDLFCELPKNSFNTSRQRYDIEAFYSCGRQGNYFKVEHSNSNIYSNGGGQSVRIGGFPGSSRRGPNEYMVVSVPPGIYYHAMEVARGYRSAVAKTAGVIVPSFRLDQGEISFIGFDPIESRLRQILGSKKNPDKNSTASLLSQIEDLTKFHEDESKIHVKLISGSFLELKAPDMAENTRIAEIGFVIGICQTRESETKCIHSAIGSTGDKEENKVSS